MKIDFETSCTTILNVGLSLLGEKKEESNHCRVLILVDNSSEEQILWLQRELELRSAEQGLRSRRVIYSILYLVRQFQFKSVVHGMEPNGHQDEPFDLPQEPTEQEIRLFKLLLKRALIIQKDCSTLLNHCLDAIWF